MVTLWHMLTLFAGATAFGGSLAAATTQGGGSQRLTLAIGMGLCLGALCSYAVRSTGKRVFRQSNSERKLRLLYFAAVAGCLVAPYLSFQVTRIAIRRVAPAADIFHTLK